MELVPSPTTLECSKCGMEIKDAGYLPARESEGEYDPVPEASICDTCGFNEVGMREFYLKVIVPMADAAGSTRWG